jgi:hypothetical protein
MGVDGSDISTARPALNAVLFDVKTTTAGRHQMARKTVFVSDFSNKEIADEKQSATITIRYGDGRRGVVVADAHVDDKIVAEIAQAGRQQARRGRPKKT